MYDIFYLCRIWYQEGVQLRPKGVSRERPLDVLWYLPEKHIRKVSLGTQEQEPDREDAQGGIFDIELFGLGKSDRIIRHFSIREDEGDKDQFTDSIHYVTVELPKFHKSKAELKSKQDYMLYAITNMKEMEEIPEEFLGKGFDKIVWSV